MSSLESLFFSCVDVPILHYITGNHGHLPVELVSIYIPTYVMLATCSQACSDITDVQMSGDRGGQHRDLR